MQLLSGMVVQPASRVDHVAFVRRLPLTVTQAGTSIETIVIQRVVAIQPSCIVRTHIWPYTWINSDHYLTNRSDISCLFTDCASWHAENGYPGRQTENVASGAGEIESLSTMYTIARSQNCGFAAKQEQDCRGQHDDDCRLRIRTRRTLPGLVYQLSVSREECWPAVSDSCPHFSRVWSSADCCDDKQTVANSTCSPQRYRCRSAKFRIVYRFNKYELFDTTFQLPSVYVQTEWTQKILPTRQSHGALRMHGVERVHSHRLQHPGGSVHSSIPQDAAGIVHSYIHEDPAGRVQNIFSQVQTAPTELNLLLSRRLALSRHSLPKFQLPSEVWPGPHWGRPPSPRARTSPLAQGSTSKHRRHRWSLWPSIAMLVLLQLSFQGLASVGAQGLIGTVSTCDKEGEEVLIPSITDNPCIKCVCKNKQVECETKRCKNVDGCHAILFDQPSIMCCEVCKGCRYQGTHYESGESWRDKKDPCKQYACRAGVVSVSRVQCFSHCYHPVPVLGQCCPACEGCFFRGHTYRDEDRFQLPTDVCTTCTCQNGKLTCEREQCPVLNCPPEVIFQSKNECCPQCKGQRLIFDVPTQCYFAKSVYKRNQQFQPDTCSTCICKSGTSVCETATCPALDCPETERTTLDDSHCCVQCWEKKACLFDGKYYKHQEEWKPSVCIQCSCEDGVSYCQRERCSNSLWCPQGYRLLLTENECCPKCIEHDAVCSVFGDPHYRTFDGLMYSFQGTCKYILARDCSKNDFLIKVRNGVRFSSGFAWTQMLVVFIFKHRISLLQNSVVKVDKRRARLPYNRSGMFSIVKVGELVKLSTTLGLEVTWDGDSFVEVTVTTKYKHRLCGLCGNYNGIKSDDLISSDGTIYMSGNEYGHSWRIGSTRSCKMRPHFQETHPLCERDYRAKLRAHRVCSVFYSRTFTKCRQKVSADVYVSSCITDMCDCPEGRYCACEAIRAYTSRCTRSGFSVTWDKMNNCQEPESCPKSSVKVDCAAVCPKTCEDAHVEGPCPDLCLRGCLCQEGKVWHKGACVATSDCTYRS